MKNKDFVKLAAAAPTAYVPAEEKETAMEKFAGCALHARRIYATAAEFIYALRYHAMNINGTWDNDALHEMREISKRVDII